MACVSSCHCGTLSATVDEDLPAKGMTCNCSICRRKGNVHHFTTPDKVTFVRPVGEVGEYTFNKHNVRHQFCVVCGCAPFAEGVGPGGVPMVEISLRCVPDCDLDDLEIVEFDGAAIQTVLKPGALDYRAPHDRADQPSVRGPSAERG